MPWQHTRHSTRSAPDRNRTKNVVFLKAFSRLQHCSPLSRQTEGHAMAVKVPQLLRQVNTCTGQVIFLFASRQAQTGTGCAAAAPRLKVVVEGKIFVGVLRPQCCSTWTHKAAAPVQVPQQPLHACRQSGPFRAAKSSFQGAIGIASVPASSCRGRSTFKIHCRRAACGQLHAPPRRCRCGIRHLRDPAHAQIP